MVALFGGDGRSGAGKPHWDLGVRRRILDTIAMIALHVKVDLNLIGKM